jgi:DNA-binding NarL/FixJ family response regulator
VFDGRFIAPNVDFAAWRLPRSTAPHQYIPAPQPAILRILVAGDHECLRSSLTTMLETDPTLKVVGEASDDCEAVKLACKLHPDIVLIDLDMRCCDKFEAVAEITARGLASAVVGLTIHDDQAERNQAAQAGVNLLLEKGIPYRQLINALRLAATNSSTP